MHQVFPSTACRILLFLLVVFQPIAISQPGPQPCPENAIVLTGSDYPQFIYSPYDELRTYPPNTDCRFVLVARSMQHRIHMTVIESKLEEPLFSECEDYVSVKDGGLPTSDEVIRWCGTYYPPSLTSSGDSLYVHFHSDNIVQQRGFNVSFVDYLIPGCPSDWIRDDENMYCYKMFSSAHGYTFVESQRNCFYERSNLLTIENAREYQFIVGKYADSHKFPWIGYNDANKEGVFDPIDPNVPIWPDDLSTASRGDHKDKDCMFFDWTVRDNTAHTVDDCRNRHAFICKKRQDGTTVPIQLSATLLRHGFEDPVFNYTLLLILLLLLLLLLIILWIIYQKLKRRNVVAASEGSRLVSQSTSTVPPGTSAITLEPVPEDKKKKKDTGKTTSTDAVKRAIAVSASRTSGAAGLALQKTEQEETFQLDDSLFVNSEKHEHGYPQQHTTGHQQQYQATSSQSPRIRSSPNQPGDSQQNVEIIQRRDSDPVLSEESEAELGVGETPLPTSPVKGDNISTSANLLSPPRDRSHLYESGPVTVTTKDETAETVAVGRTKDGVASSSISKEPKALSSTLPPVGEPISREATLQTGNVTVPSSHRSRGTQPAHGFERPRVGTLENVSAISLDEFWQDNK
ncbi:unnamed protein product [Bursaphelenchus okinawaensis]|uniref:CUB domain-containing protein n=1 Tax=Bursaphelenchus okinawaensis TaxID=465554 RepID=A0A811KNJ0_9BILA|nr:unnamed protein product [Bursaphelenchus okinawaensis]CAG9108410.1 unnamed protein product [Bursaphelenchus okinawaensis]